MMLRILHDQVEERVRSIRDKHAWPCREGCDLCCRGLAAIPSLTAPEWELVRVGFEQLSKAARAEVLRRTANLEGACRPITCPFLDATSGACLIYAQRPIACRTYGFYRERDVGLYCKKIEAAVEAGRYSDVVWGNALSVEAKLDEFGEWKELLTWFREARTL